jgi:hypothetical protein
MFWGVVGLERGPLNLVGTTEELLDRKCSGSCLENRDYGRRDPSHWPRGTLYPQNVGNHFADRRRSLGRYSSMADSNYGAFFEWGVALLFGFDGYVTAINEWRIRWECPYEAWSEGCVYISRPQLTLNLAGFQIRRNHAQTQMRLKNFSRNKHSLA